MTKLLVFTFLLICFYTDLKPQSSREDSLLQVLKYQKDTSRINTLNELSWYYLSRDLEKSKYMGLTALKEANLIGFSLGLITAHRRLADIFRESSNYKKSQHHLFQALRIADSINATIEKLKIYNGLGNLYTNLDDFSNALIYYQKAEEISLSSKQLSFYTSICTNLGILLENNNEFEKAKSYYFKGLSCTDSITTTEAYYNLIQHLGSAYFYSDNIDSAFFLNNIAKEKYLKNNDQYGVAACYLNEGIYFEELEKYDSAIFTYQTGLQYAIDANNLDIQCEFLQNIMLTYGAIGNIDSMYHYFYLSEDYGQKLQQAKTDKAIHEIAIKYDVEKKEQSLKMAQQENEKVELSNSLQQKTIYFLLSVIVIIGLIVFIFYKLYREKQQLTELEVVSKNQEIEGLIKDQEIKTYSAQIEGIEKERKRVAQDLHDQIGGILATIKLQFESQDSLNEKSLNHVKNLVNESIKSVRSISHNLSDGRIDEMGLIRSIQNLKESLIDSGKMDFDLFLENYNDSCSPEKEREIFKIILELLSNTLKHAHADHIVLQINIIDQIIHITFEDNGIGFNPKQIKKGLGMRTISQRVETLLGNWYIDSKESHGSTVVIEIPLS